MRGSWRPNINCNILTPLLWPSRCVFLVLLMLNWRPRGPLCWVMASFTASYQQLLWSPNSIGVPEGPLGQVWLSLPHLVSLRLELHCLQLLARRTPLSYIIVRRPLAFLGRVEGQNITITVSKQYVVEFPSVLYFWGYFIKPYCFPICNFS